MKKMSYIYVQQLGQTEKNVLLEIQKKSHKIIIVQYLFIKSLNNKLNIALMLCVYVCLMCVCVCAF